SRSNRPRGSAWAAWNRSAAARRTSPSTSNRGPTSSSAPCPDTAKRAWKGRSPSNSEALDDTREPRARRVRVRGVKVMGAVELVVVDRESSGVEACARYARELDVDDRVEAPVGDQHARLRARGQVV